MIIKGKKWKYIEKFRTQKYTEKKNEKQKNASNCLPGKSGIEGYFITINKYVDKNWILIVK